MYELRDIGFSTCVGIGGDPVVGTIHIDCLAAFEADPETELIVLIGEISEIGEIGGDAEERAAASIAGFTAPEGRAMGHAGAIVSGTSGTAQAKKAGLEAVGVRVGETPSATARLVTTRSPPLRGRYDPVRSQYDPVRSRYGPAPAQPIPWRSGSRANSRSAVSGTTRSTACSRRARWRRSAVLRSSGARSSRSSMPASMRRVT